MINMRWITILAVLLPLSFAAPVAVAGPSVCEKALSQIHDLHDRWTDVRSKSLFRQLPLAQRKAIRDAIFAPEDELENHLQVARMTGGANPIEKVTDLILRLRQRSLVERWLFFANSFLKTGSSSPPSESLPDSLLKKVLQIVKKGSLDSAEWLAWVVSPVPVQMFLYDSKLRSIYQSVAHDPKVILSDAQSAELEARGLKKDLELFREVKRGESPLRRQTRRLGHMGLNRVPQILSLTALLLTTPWSHSTPVDTYLNQVIERKGQARVEILLDSTGLPHTAIRIDDLVYSPSQAMVTVSTASTYLNLTAGTQAPRRLIGLDLKLTDPQVDKIKRKLESLVWSNYNNFTGAFDCTTVIFDVLKEDGLQVPPVVDASPSLSIAWLVSEGMIGNAVVGDLESIELKSKASTTLTWTSAMLSASIEAKLFYFGAPYFWSTQSRIRSDGRLYWESQSAREFDEDLILKVVERIKLEPWYRDIQLRFESVELQRLSSTEEAYLRKKSQLQAHWAKNLAAKISLLKEQIAKDSSATLSMDLRREIVALERLSLENGKK